MLHKYATLKVLAARMGEIPPVAGDAFRRTAVRWNPEYEPRPGFLYVRSRAISSRTNDNFDTFPAAEIAKAYRTFVGKPVFVNHHNADHRRARGVIIDAVLHEDLAPDGSQDTWVEVLMEIDAITFPKLAEAILKGRIDRTSMGTSVGVSECSYCGNRAATMAEFCKHIPAMKGQRITRLNPETGKRESVLVSEICYDLTFFENSLLVEDPADPTAVAWIDSLAGLEGHEALAGLLAQATYQDLPSTEDIKTAVRTVIARRQAEQTWPELPHEAARTMTWAQVQATYPTYDNDHLGYAVDGLANDPSDGTPIIDSLDFVLETVNIREVRFVRYDAGDPRFDRARDGYQSGVTMTPPLLVRRAGELLTVDGNHRLSAALSAGRTQIEAIVAQSPRTDRYTGRGAPGTVGSRVAVARTAAAPEEFTYEVVARGASGLAARHDGSVRAYTARHLAGEMEWYEDGEIKWVWVAPQFRRRGLATEMLRRAREVRPDVHHSEAVSADGKAWSQKVASLPAGVSLVYSDFDAALPRIRAEVGDQMIGTLSWWSTTGEVFSVSVDEGYRRQGIATAMWEQAKAIEPRLHHSTELSEDGKAWSQRVAGAGRRYRVREMYDSWVVWDTEKDASIEAHPTRNSAQRQAKGLNEEHEDRMAHPDEYVGSHHTASRGPLAAWEDMVARVLPKMSVAALKSYIHDVLRAEGYEDPEGVDVYADMSLVGVGSVTQFKPESVTKYVPELGHTPEVGFAPEQMNALTALHECAHVIQGGYPYGVNVFSEESHGPRWQAIYTGLLSKHLPEVGTPHTGSLGRMAKEAFDYDQARSTYDQVRWIAKDLTVHQAGDLLRKVLRDAGFPHANFASVMPHPRPDQAHGSVGWQPEPFDLGDYYPIVFLAEHSRNEFTLLHEAAHIIRNGPEMAGRNTTGTDFEHDGSHDQRWWDTMTRLIGMYGSPLFANAFQHLVLRDVDPGLLRAAKVHVPDDPSRYGDTSIRYELGGSAVMDPRDLPPVVYHVTTAGSRIGSVLRADFGKGGGLGGNTGEERSVSFTISRDIASDIASGMRAMATAARLYKAGADIIDVLVDMAVEEGWSWDEAETMRGHSDFSGAVNTWFFARQRIAGIRNPIFFGVDVDRWAKVDPADVGWVTATREDIIASGAMVTDFDLGRGGIGHGLEEIRVWGDVKVGGFTRAASLRRIAADYWMNHRPQQPGVGVPSLDACATAFGYSEDDVEAFYRSGVDSFAPSAAYAREAVEQVRAARGKPDHLVDIYRAVPPGVDRFAQGDWVTLSRSYAEEHLSAILDGQGSVLHARVPARQVFPSGEWDVLEWGYWGVGSARTASGYWMSHRPGADGPPLHDLLQGDMVPRDVYDSPQHYTGFRGAEARESIDVVRRVRGNPDAMVTIYRSLPPNVPQQINPGDWVALSRTYAQMHGLDRGWEEWVEPKVPDVFEEGEGWVQHDDSWPVISRQVPAWQVRWDVNDLVEWGWHPNAPRTASLQSLAADLDPALAERVEFVVEHRFGGQMMQAKVDGKPVGYLLWEDEEIKDIQVESEYQYKGLASELYRRVKAIEPNLMHSGPFSDAGLAFARAHGFDGEVFYDANEEYGSEWGYPWVEQWIVDDLKAMEATGSLHTAMADTTGIPEIDALIEDFKRQPLDPREWGPGGLVTEMSDPYNAHGYCQTLSEQFVEFAKARGFQASTTDMYLEEIGYTPTGGPYGEVLDENGDIIQGYYPEHTVATITVDDGSPYGRDIYIDFTAAQYGYSDFPKVTGSVHTASPARGEKLPWKVTYRYSNGFEGTRSSREPFIGINLVHSAMQAQEAGRIESFEITLTHLPTGTSVDLTADNVDQVQTWLLDSPSGRNGLEGLSTTAQYGYTEFFPYVHGSLARQHTSRITDEWERWQRGGCGDYAMALIGQDPRLRLGAIVERTWDEDDQASYDNEAHFFAHDDQYAYDSAGRHPLPYFGFYEQTHGLTPSPDPDDLDVPGLVCVLDIDPDDYDLTQDPHPQDMEEALAHARRHNIVAGSRTTTASSLTLEDYISVAEEAVERSHPAAGRLWHLPSKSDYPKAYENPDFWEAMAPVTEFVHEVLRKAGKPVHEWFRVDSDGWHVTQMGVQGATDGLNWIDLRSPATLITILHECAHVIRGTAENVGHDRAFVETMASLLDAWVSPAAAEQFRHLVGFHDEMKREGYAGWAEAEDPSAEVTLEVAYRRDYDGDPLPEGQAMVIARKGTAVVGALRWSYYDDPPVVVDVSVHPNHRRQGIATAMLAEARKRESRLVHSDVLTDDGRAWMQAVGSLHTAQRVRSGWRMMHGVTAPEGYYLPQFVAQAETDEGLLVYQVQMKVGGPSGETAGVLSWYDGVEPDVYGEYRAEGEIADVTVFEPHRRKGLATALLAAARSIDPKVHHSWDLTDDGRAWMQAVGSMLDWQSPTSGWKRSPGGNNYRTSIVGKNGLTYYIAGSFDKIEAFTEKPWGTGSEIMKVPVGTLVAWEWNGRREIYQVGVNKEHRRQGVASAMLALAREFYPDLVHAGPGSLSDDGAAWAAAYASLRTASAEREIVVSAEGHLWTWRCSVCGEGPPNRGYRDKDMAREMGHTHAQWCWDLGWDDEPMIREAARDEAFLAEVTWRQQGRLSGYGVKLMARHPDQDPGKVGVGYILFTEDSIENLWVDPRFRRKGLATEMLRRAREIAPTLKHGPVFSDEGLAWARSQGFTGDVVDTGEGYRWKTASTLTGRT